VTGTPRGCDGTKNCDEHPYLNTEHPIVTDLRRPHEEALKRP